MFDLKTKPLIDTTRFTATARPGQTTQRHLDAQSAKREYHARLWLRAPYWV